MKHFDQRHFGIQTRIRICIFRNITFLCLFCNLCPCLSDAVPVKLPATMRRALMTLTATQRLSIYDYCVEVAKAAHRSAHFDDDELMLLEDQNGRCLCYLLSISYRDGGSVFFDYKLPFSCSKGLVFSFNVLCVCVFV